MLVDILYISLVIVVILDIVSSFYLIYAIWCIVKFGHQSKYKKIYKEPATILIPICDLDIGLYKNLYSICQQDYGEYQLLLGVQDSSNPAIDVARRIIREFPDRDITLVIDGRAAEANPKIGNLSNLYPYAKHAVLVILDSDMRVTPGYLSTILAPFQDPSVGLVTCLYKGTAASGLPSLLGSMFINEWFLPSALVARYLQKSRDCFGATMAVRRDAFDSAGGFARLGCYLADDYVLGKIIVQQGYRVHLSSYVVENVVRERNFKTLFFHELRWARTIRAVAPIGYTFSFIMYTTPLAIMAGVLDELTTDTDFFEWGFIVLAIVLRIALHFVARNVLRLPHGPSPWLVPFRDLLSFSVWAIGLFGRDVMWRGRAFSVDGEGRLIAKGNYANAENAVSQPPVV